MAPDLSTPSFQTSPPCARQPQRTTIQDVPLPTGELVLFRYAFPDDVRARVGHSGIRLSLKTGYLREAIPIAAVLANALKLTLSGDCMLTYHEIRSHLHRLLQKLLMRDAQQFGSRNISFPELGLEITSAELYASTAFLYKKKIADESLLLELADRCVPRLIEKGVFTLEEVTDDILLLKYQG